jgi:hypothetical protein
MTNENVALSVAKGLLVYHREILRVRSMVLSFVKDNLRKTVNAASSSITKEGICYY